MSGQLFCGLTPMHPKQYEREEEMPEHVRSLVRRLMMLLLDGPLPALVAFRNQYAAARLVHLDWTGVGFFASFDVPNDVPPVEPARISGGSAYIKVEGLEYGAGCVLHVIDGRLGCLEAFSYGEPWPEDAVIVEVCDAIPILPRPSPSPSQISVERVSVTVPTKANWLWTAVFVGLVLGMTALMMELL